MARRNGHCCHSLVTIYGCLFHHVCIYLIFSTFISRFFYWLIIWGLACKSIFKYISSRLISLFEMNIFFTCCDSVDFWPCMFNNSCKCMVSVLCVCLVLMGCMFLEQQYKMHLLKSSSAIRKKKHCVLKKTNKKNIIIKINVHHNYSCFLSLRVNNRHQNNSNNNNT